MAVGARFYHLELCLCCFKIARPTMPVPPPLPILVFDTPGFGRIEIHRAKEGVLLETLTGLEKLAPLLKAHNSNNKNS